MYELKVLILGKDPSLFNTQEEKHIGDARRRHIFYCLRLRERFPGSEIRILTYTPSKSGINFDAPCEGLQLYGTASLHRATYALDLLRTLPRVLSDGWRPDILTVQTPWEEGVAGCLVSKWIGASFVPQLHFDLFSQDWAAEHWLNPWRKRVAKQMLRCAQRVRVVSEALRENVAKECGIPLGRILVAPVGVNLVRALGGKREFKARILPSIAERKVVLFVGRLCAQKNLGLWVDVAQQIARQHPDVAFVIVGDGPEEGTMRERVRDIGLDNRFFFLGRKMHEELPQIYAAADVFLLTSHYEGFGRVVLESMLSSVPVVSTACTGPEDLVEQGITGHLLPRGDAEGLARAVSRILTDTSKAEAIGKAGSVRAQAMFSLDTLTERLIDVWASV